MQKLNRYFAAFLGVLFIVAAGLTGCTDSTPAERIHRLSKVAALGVLAEDATKDDELSAIADHLDALLAGDTITDALIADLAAELVRAGKVDRREALIVAAVAQELWAEFRPADGVLRLDSPQVREALASFTAGLRAAVVFSRALGT